MYKNKNMVFFFDESFHSREINKKTIEDKEFFDNYVMTGIGCLKRDLHKNEILYAQFEERFKKLFSINENDELKSKIVKKEQYKYGIKSFNKKSLELYKDFWKLMNQSDYIYYICAISKLEYILTQFNYNIWGVRDYSSFVYSIVKAVNVYRPKEVLKALFEENDLLLGELVKFLRRKISENDNNPIKVYENISFKECITILEEINGKNINLKWKYNNIFIGFKKFVNELELNNVRVVIDKEGNPNNNTANACKKEGFKNVIETDSKENITLRCIDLMCGFISKMMRAIYEDTKTTDDEEYKERKILNKNWFEINEEQFWLYKDIAKYFKKYSKYYWSTYISIYFDSFFQFIDLIYYFDMFENFEKFNSMDSNNHRERYNGFIINHIYEKFKERGWM